MRKMALRWNRRARLGTRPASARLPKGSAAVLVEGDDPAVAQFVLEIGFDRSRPDAVVQGEAVLLDRHGMGDGLLAGPLAVDEGLLDTRARPARDIPPSPAAKVSATRIVSRQDAYQALERTSAAAPVANAAEPGVQGEARRRMDGIRQRAPALP